MRYIKANDPDVLNFIEIKHDLNTYINITNLELYTLYNISVAGYTRTGAGNFIETQSWTDEGGESHNVFTLDYQSPGLGQYFSKSLIIHKENTKENNV